MLEEEDSPSEPQTANHPRWQGFFLQCHDPELVCLTSLFHLDALYISLLCFLSVSPLYTWTPTSHSLVGDDKLGNISLVFDCISVILDTGLD